MRHNHSLNKVLLLFIFLFLSFVTACQSVNTDAGKIPGEVTKSSPTEQQSSPETNTKDSSDTDKDKPQFIQASVTRVIDGDTIEVKINGKKDTVRLLLVDTPETHHPDKPVQPFGPEASQFTKDTLEGQSIELELGTTERDKYNRLLAYVYIDGQMFNELLLSKGLARVAYVYPPNDKYVEQFRKIEATAKNQKMNIWSMEGYVQEDGFHEEVAEVSNDQQTTQETEKGYDNQPYDPNGEDKDCSDFATRDEAQFFFIAAGGPEKDPHHLDSDGDGIVCEDLP